MDPELASVHSAGRMALVDPELVFVESAVRTTVVKAAFGHLATRMAVVDMAFGHSAAKMMEATFASWIYSFRFAAAGSPLLTHLQLLCAAQSLPSPSLGQFILEASHPCTFRLVP